MWKRPLDPNKKSFGFVINQYQLDFLRKKAREVRAREGFEVSVSDLVKRAVQATYPLYDSEKNLIECK